MTKYIDLQNSKPQEHYDVVKKLEADGYRWAYSTFGNPTFYKKGEGTITILAGIIEQDGYFSYSD